MATLDEEAKIEARKDYWRQWIKDWCWTMALVAAFTIVMLLASYQTDILLDYLHPTPQHNEQNKETLREIN